MKMVNNIYVRGTSQTMMKQISYRHLHLLLGFFRNFNIIFNVIIGHFCVYTDL